MIELNHTLLPDNSILFFQIFKNVYLNNKIFSYVKTKNQKYYDKYNYYEIIDTEKMFKYTKNYSDGLRELYMYKVKNGDTLYFSAYTNTIFKVFNQDNEINCEFYVDLFTNYSRYFKCKTTISSILETNCLVALKVLFERLDNTLGKEYMEYLELSSINLYVSSISSQSFEISSYLKSKFKFKLSNQRQSQIWKSIFQFQEPEEYNQSQQEDEHINKISIGALDKTIDYLYRIEGIKEPIKLDQNVSLQFSIGKQTKLENLIEICSTISYLIKYVKLAEFTRSFSMIEFGGDKTRESPLPPILEKTFNYEELISLLKDGNTFTKQELSSELCDIDIDSITNKNIELVKQLIIMAIWYGKSFQTTNLLFYHSKFCGIHYYGIQESQIESLSSCNYTELKKYIHNSFSSGTLQSKPFEYYKSNTAKHQQFVDLAIKDIFDDQVDGSKKISFINLIEIIFKFNSPSLLEYTLGELQKYKPIEELFYGQIHFTILIERVPSTKIFDIIYPIVKSNGTFDYLHLLNLFRSPYGYYTAKEIELKQTLLNHFKSNYNQDYHKSISKLENDSEVLLSSTFVFDNFTDFIDKFTPTISNVSTVQQKSCGYGYGGSISDRIWLNKFIHLYSITPLDSGKYQCFGDFKILQWVYENQPQDLISGRCQTDLLKAPHTTNSPLFLQYYYFSNQFELILNENDQYNIYTKNSNLNYYYKLLYKEEYIVSSIIERGDLKDLQTLISKLSYIFDSANSIIDSSRPTFKKFIKKPIIEQIVKSNRIELFQYMFNQYNSFFTLKYLKRLLNVAFNFVNLEIVDFILNSNDGKDRIQLLSQPKYFEINDIPSVSTINNTKVIDVRLYLKDMYFYSSKDKSK